MIHSPPRARAVENQPPIQRRCASLASTARSDSGRRGNSLHQIAQSDFFISNKTWQADATGLR
jgi:hypothetical protein